MTKLRLFQSLLLLFIATSLNAQYPRDAAIELVRNQMLASEIGHLNLYASFNIKFGSEGLPLLNKQPLHYPYDENWVFFIDDHPTASWNHPCRYIFVDAITGNDSIITNESIYPTNLSSDFEILSLIDTSSCTPVYNQPVSFMSNNVTLNPHLYAVMIVGIEDDTAVRQPQSWNDISAVYSTLEKVYGYKPENMFVHYFTGNGARGKDLDGGLLSIDIDYAAYKDIIKHTFKCLAGEEFDPLIPKLHPDDQLFVYVDDHGDASGGHSWIILPDPNIPPNPFKDIYDTTLANWVKNIQCGQMIFLFEQCFSGGFKDDLETHVGDACKNRSIYTSTSSNLVERMDYKISHQQYGEFIFYWTAAIRGYFPDVKFKQPWINGFPVYDTLLYPVFPYNSCFSNCPNNPTHPYYNPDLNGDGFTTMGEAFNYANDYGAWSVSGFFCPDSAALLSYTDPQSYKNIGFQEDLQSLSGLAGKILQTQTVENRSYLVGGPLVVESNATLSFNASGADTAKVFFINDLADLTVNAGAHLNTGLGMIFGGMDQNEIKISGSVNLINDVTFKKIPPGTFFAGLQLNNHNTEVTLSNVHFTNAGLVNNGHHLRVNDGSIFTNCMQLNSNYGNINISNSVFTETSIYLNNLLHDDTFTDSIFNNSITASVNHDAINISNYTNFTVQNNTISGAGTNYSGIGLFYSGLGASVNYDIVNNNITNCQTGITGYNSNALIRYNHINSNNIGIKSVNYSNLRILGAQLNTPSNLSQEINNNTSYEIYSYFDFPYIRFNKIYDETDPSGCLIYVDSDERDGLLPITFDVRYNCWKNNSIPSQLCSIYGNNATFSYEPVFCLSTPTHDTIPDPKEGMFNIGDSLFHAGNFLEAKNQFVSLIEQYPDSKYSQDAMKELFGVEKFVTNNYLALKQYYLTHDSIVADSALSKIGAFLATRCDLELEELESAISWYEDQILNPKSSEDSIFAIIDLEDIFLQMVNGGNKATYVGRLQQFVPTSVEEYSIYRDSLLALIPFDHTKDGGMGKTIKGLKPGELIQNQPNPFTTNTYIYYKLGSNCSHVELRITDILGRIRQKLLLTDNTFGIHKVEFNPEELHNGVYQYSLVVDGKLVDSKKMIFMK